MFLKVAIVLFDGLKYDIILFDLMVRFIQNQFVNDDECFLVPALFVVLEIIGVRFVDIDLFSLR